MSNSPFGKTAEDWERDREEQSDEVWIKGFKAGETRIRFLQEPNKMVTYREHYVEGPGYFPCSEKGDCVGCQDKEGRQRSRKFAFNALNENRQVGVYKIGVRTHRLLQSKHQRLGTICDRDYIIIRTGTGLDTNYDVEAGKQYTIPGFDDIELYDIGQVLADKYAQAVAAYEGTEPPKPQAGVGRNVGEPWSEPEEPIRIDAPKKAKSKPAPVPEFKTDEAQAEATSPESNGGWVNIADMSTPELRGFLEKAGIPFQSNSPRTKLVVLAEKYQADHSPF